MCTAYTEIEYGAQDACKNREDDICTWNCPLLIEYSNY